MSVVTTPGTVTTESSRPAWLTAVAAGVALLHIFFNSFSPLSELWMSLLHFGTLGALVALTVPCRKSAQTPLSNACDIGLALVAFGSSVALIAGEDAFYDRGQTFSILNWSVALALVLCALELTRRATGWVIPILAIAAITYTAWWGKFVPGVFQFPGLTWETVLYRATYAGDGMFGTIARISWSYVFMFILFGTFLLKSGASDVILALARAAAGRIAGGPGFVAVIGSGLMGSVSGSAIGNTVSTGVVTIPLMKRAGFPARTAAGIEAASSTGGQLMPPVMGAGAFLMANYTGESYLTIISVATLPAALYFLSIAFHVRISALKLGLRPENNTQSQDQENHNLAKSWPVLLPILVLVGLLIAGFTPTWSAAAATIATVVCARLGPHPMNMRDVIETLAQGSLTAASISVLLVSVGLVVMAVTTTGLGPTVSQMIVSWSGGSLLLTLTFIALASLVLGLGLPVTAAYVVLAPLAAPALADLMLDAKLLEALMTGSLSESAKTILMVILPEQAAALGSAMPREDALILLAAIPPELRTTVSDQALSASTLAATLLTAHMIVFWLSQDSNVTPPVCLTAYAAAGIAGTNPLATGFTAWSYAKGLYLIPLVMAFTPLIGGDAVTLLQITLFTIGGLYAFTATLHGHLEGKVSIPFRLITAALAVVLFWPHGSWAIGGIAMLLLSGVIVISKRSQPI
ncbi:MAG: TRAP transporter fused permease subunit [Rhodospirillaceae bacterium]